MPEIFSSDETPQAPQDEAERTSGLMRVAGVSPEKEKEILADQKEVFDNQKILNREREKTPEELEIINGILDNLPQSIKKYGGKMPPIKPEHIHVADYNQFTDEEKKRLGGVKGRYAGESQSAVVLVNRKEENNLTFALRTAHELIHFCAFQSVTANQEKETLSQRRGGLIVTAKERGKNEFYFNDFNEAITEELTKRFDKEFFETIPALSGNIVDREKSRSIRKNKSTANPKLAEKKAKEICNIITLQEDSGMWKSTIESYRFTAERKKLWQVIGDIYQNNKEDFETEEDVFKVFAETYFTGKLLPVARLVEKTHGKGFFRKLGSETKESKNK